MSHSFSCLSAQRRTNERTNEPTKKRNSNSGAFALARDDIRRARRGARRTPSSCTIACIDYTHTHPDESTRLLGKRETRNYFKIRSVLRGNFSRNQQSIVPSMDLPANRQEISPLQQRKNRSVRGWTLENGRNRSHQPTNRPILRLWITKVSTRLFSKLRRRMEREKKKKRNDRRRHALDACSSSFVTLYSVVDQSQCVSNRWLITKEK